MYRQGEHSQYVAPVRTHRGRADKKPAVDVGHQLDKTVPGLTVDPPTSRLARSAEPVRTLIPESRAARSVRPTAAISGSVKVTRGTAR
jgi:hypothetical protein